MKKLLLQLLALVFVVSATPISKYYYADIEFRSPKQLQDLRDQGYDIGGVNYENKTISLIVQDSQLRQLKQREQVSWREAPRSPDAEYKTPDEIKQILLKAEVDYPHLVATEVIGKSIEDRDIYAVNLTARFVSPGGSKKPTLLFDYLHHAREIMTPEVALDMIEYLTQNYESDPEVKKWMDNYSIWLVPMVNPDGNNKVWTSSSMWRKNMRGGYGVDVNRNYPYDWNACDGSSGFQWSDMYRGESAGSEPETQALMSLATRIKPVFNVSYHSYSELVIYPFGCSPKKIPPADKELYEGIGKELANRLERDSGTGSYQYGTAPELLYDVDGGSIDWMYGQESIFSYVIEVNSTSQGFQPSFSSWRDSTVRRQRKGWQYILSQMENPKIAKFWSGKK